MTGSCRRGHFLWRQTGCGVCLNRAVVLVIVCIVPRLVLVTVHVRSPVATHYSRLCVACSWRKVALLLSSAQSRTRWERLGRKRCRTLITGPTYFWRLTSTPPVGRRLNQALSSTVYRLNARDSHQRRRGLKKTRRRRTLQFSDRQLQISDRRILWVLKISFLPLNSPKMGTFSPNSALLHETFPTTTKVRDRVKSRGQLLPCPYAMTPLENALITITSQRLEVQLYLI